MLKNDIVKEMKRSKLLILSALILGSLFFADKSFAADPSLVVGASPTTVYVGGTFTVYVNVNSSSVATNAYGVIVKYPKNLAKVTSGNIVASGSPCDRAVEGFHYSNASGSATFSCGMPSPGYKGSGGNIGVIKFKALALGTANISIASGSSMYGNDATGNNIIAGRGAVNVHIVAPPPPAIAGPKISSSTHPNQKDWYSSRHVILSWKPGANATSYSYLLNKTPTSVPGNIADTKDKTYETDLDADGIWYFHIKSYTSGGWSQTSHYKLQIDSAPPADFVPEIEPSGVVKTSTPKIYFNTTDGKSGIAYYEVRIDDGEYLKTDSPYTTPSLTSGRHTVTVAAYDSAGNVTYGKNEFHIYEVPPPFISEKDYQKFVLGEEIPVKGTAVPDSTVNVYLNSFDKLLGTAQTDSLGNWKYTISGLKLMPGDYTVFATTVDKETSILSAMSNIYHFTVSGKSVRIGFWVIPCWWAAALLLGLIILLILLIIWLIAWYKRRKRKQVEELKELEQLVHKEFDEIEEGVEDELATTLHEHGTHKRAEIEKGFEEDTDELLDKEEKKIIREIDKIIAEDEENKK